MDSDSKGSEANVRLAVLMLVKLKIFCHLTYSGESDSIYVTPSPSKHVTASHIADVVVHLESNVGAPRGWLEQSGSWSSPEILMVEMGGKPYWSPPRCYLMRRVALRILPPRGCVRTGLPCSCCSGQVSSQPEVISGGTQKRRLCQVRAVRSSRGQDRRKVRE